MSHLRLIVILLFFGKSIIGLGQWTEISIPTNQSLYTVDIHESGVCFAGGVDLIKSDDFGLTWEEVIFTGPLALALDGVQVNSIQILNASTIICVGWSIANNTNAIIKSTDGGVNWDFQFLGTTGSGLQFYHVEFFDELSGIVVGEAGTIYRSTDGGNTWVSKISGTFSDLFDVTYSTSNVCVAVGNGVIVRSTNGGNTWSPQSHAGKNFVSVKFEPLTNTYVAAYNNTSLQSSLFRSNNGGITWTPSALSEDEIENHETLTNDTILFCLDYKLQVSFNGGIDYFVYTPIVTGVNDIEFNGSCGLAVSAPGGVGKVFRYNFSLPISVQPVLDFNFQIAVCEGDVMTYTATNNALDSYEWLVNDVSVATGTSFGFTHLNPGTDEIKLVSSYGGIFDTIQHNVSVNPNPEVLPFNIVANPYSCIGSWYGFIVEDILGSDGYTVMHNGVPVSSYSTLGLDKYFQVSSVTGDYTFEVLKWETNGCGTAEVIDSFTVVVEASEDPNTTFYAADSAVCYSDVSQIIIPDTEPDYLYALYSGLTFISSGSSSIGDSVFLSTNPILGVQNYQVEVTSVGLSCNTELNGLETIVVAEVNSDFNLGTGYFTENIDFLIDTSALVGTVYNWEITGTPTVFTSINNACPTVQFDSTAFGDLKLTIENATGCIDSTIHPFVVFRAPPDSITKEVCSLQQKDLPIVIATHLDKFGNLILVGYRINAPPFASYSNYYASIQKYDSEGVLVWEWTHEYTGTNDQDFSMFGSVTTDQFGNIYLTGRWEGKVFKYADTVLYDGLETIKTFLMKLNPMGELIWYSSANGSGNHRGYGHIIYNHETHHLFMSGISINNTQTFNNEPYYVGGDFHVVVLQLDTNGHVMNHFGGTSSYANMDVLEHPYYAYSVEYTVIGPEIFIKDDNSICIAGVFGPDEFEFGDLSVPDDAHNLQRFFVASIDPYDPLPEWTELNAIPFRFDPYLSSEAQLNCSATMDDENNLYAAINVTGPGGASKIVIGPDTLHGTGSYIVKLDSDLNYVWYKRFEPNYIKDIIFTKETDLFFVGHCKGFFVEWNDSLPGYILDPLNNTSNIILASMDTAGMIDWLEDIGQTADEVVYPLAANSCGDVFISGRCTEVLSYQWAWNEKDTFNCEISGVNYGDIYGGFIFKLADSMCVTGGCGTFCLDSNYFPDPVVINEGVSLATFPYQSYQWYFNGALIPGAINQQVSFIGAGIYEVYVTDLNGCNGFGSYDTTCQIGGVINMDVDYSGMQLSVVSSFESYQWFMNGVAIAGATSQYLNFTQNGNYYVEVVDDNGCLGQSDIIIINDLAFRESENVAMISVYPNPVNEILYITVQNNSSDVIFEFFDLSGRKVEIQIVFSEENSEYSASLTGLTAGVYVLRCSGDGFQFNTQIVKQ